MATVNFFNIALQQCAGIMQISPCLQCRSQIPDPLILE